MTNLREALEYKDLDGMMKPTVHIDEFASKMGDDDDVIVASFYVKSKQAATDLANWFEKGYEWVLDADVSPGEIKPGKHLVYIELRRRSRAAEHVVQAVEDLETLTEFSLSDWTLTYDDRTVELTADGMADMVPLSPQEYREQTETELNEVRVAAGIDTKSVHRPDRLLRKLQSAAGI